VAAPGAAGSEDVAVAEYVRLEVADGVATLRVDRPKMNALSVAVQEEIRAAAVEASARSDVRSVVVYGGERVFAAGADIVEMEQMSHADMVERSGHLQSALSAVAAIPKPTVSAITGYALGGGCELALCTDLRFCADDAQLGQPEIKLGVIPGAGGTQRLSRLVGPARAKDIIFTGRFVPADEALAIGLVDRVLPAADVYAAALDWAAQFSAGPVLALRAAKEAIDAGLQADLATGLEIERVQFSALFATPDRSIGMKSFLADGPGKAVFESP
jgi:enoyl-CoA hydratase/carnithine racemase